MQERAKRMLEFVNPERLVRTLDQVSGFTNDEAKREDVIIASDFFRAVFREEIKQQIIADQQNER